jgi:hypothetical protein
VSGDHEAAAGHRQQNLYFNELFQLKIQCEYMRRYRNLLAGRVRRLEILRAVASNGAIVTWAIVQSHPMIWGTIIALSQLSDALKDAIPLTARHKATIALVTSLDTLVIEALYQWEGVFGGQFSNEEITDRRRKLMQLRHEAEVEHLPTADLPERQDLLELAEGDAIAYFETMFGPFETILGPRE